VILGLITLAVLTTIAVLIVREVHHLLYVRGVRHMSIVTELQARENAAPLSSAVTHRETTSE
jgi:hypothetical protein